MLTFALKMVIGRLEQLSAEPVTAHSLTSYVYDTTTKCQLSLNYPPDLNEFNIN